MGVLETVIVTGIPAEVLGLILTALEDRELPLLSWGYVDGQFSTDEVDEVIEEELLRHPDLLHLSVGQVRGVLLDRGLLHQVVAGQGGYRTRLAEGLRLTRLLRQLFRQSNGTWWRSGLPLIADYRIDARPRSYPRRDISLADALDSWVVTPAGRSLAARALASAFVGSRHLGAFQARATEAMLRAQASGASAGIVVSAGTSSGKTLAFYLPTFMSLADRPLHSARTVQALAVYPRVELLKDQLSETYSAARRVKPALMQHGSQPLCIGALYADTPWDAEAASRNTRWTPLPGRGLVCPYLACPGEHCGGEMLWLDPDRAQGRERLVCSECRDAIEEDEIVLTRRRLLAHPPELLFTTSEMLNLRSADPKFGPLLSWLPEPGASRPRILLLDEIHTYEGIQGAQIALLLRRWRHAMGGPVTIVGLSATLRDPEVFFSRLTGLPVSSISTITPTETEFLYEGREYTLVLRADPTSGASPLSSSIQAAMLLGRLLDPPDRELLFGSRAFAFTDNLDVVNRLYHDLRDAEGFPRDHGRPRAPLAALRDPTLPNHADRYRDGQSWDIVHEIGRRLDSGYGAALQIGRTTSQDAGVAQHADLIVATSTLEVGYDDDRIGLVLQHKAPMTPASFLQRKGRAGRRRGTRPIATVVLSGYGRDRLAYQAYETLFMPEITAQRLPIGNRYVLRIHATHALLDWLASRLRQQDIRVDVRGVLTAPADPGAWQPSNREVHAVVGILQRVLTDEAIRADLERHLRRALQLDNAEVTALMWERPRALMLAVIPTILRHLNSGWLVLEPEAQHDPGVLPGAMLPEFVTRTLFLPLNVPEVEMGLPWPSAGREREYLPVAQALGEAVPGRVSKRYAIGSRGDRTWLALPAGPELDLNQVVGLGKALGAWRPDDGRDTQDRLVVRPFVLRLAKPPPPVKDTANATPVWRSALIAGDDAAVPSDVPRMPGLAARLEQVDLFTHAGRCPVEVRRMTVGATAIIREDKTERPREIRYTSQGRPAALGFAQDVDGIRMRFRALDTSGTAVQSYLGSAAWRTLAFRTAVAESRQLSGHAAIFRRNWLVSAYLAAWTQRLLDGHASRDEVRQQLRDEDWAEDVRPFLQQIGTDALSDLARDDTASNEDLTEPALVSAINQLISDTAVREELYFAARFLIGTGAGPAHESLLRRVHAWTVASAILAAVLQAVPDAREHDLIVDLRHRADGSFDVWLTETSPGGIGVVEQLAATYGRDPHRFWRAAEQALWPSEQEQTDRDLRRLLQSAVREPDGEAARTLARARQSSRIGDAVEAVQRLRHVWGRIGAVVTHPAMAALSARILRPGMDSDTDQALLAALDYWSQAEERAGVEVDARVMAVLIAQGRTPVTWPVNVGGASTDAVFSAFWPRGHDARTSHLRFWQPYDDSVVLDRLAGALDVEDAVPRIDVTTPAWLGRARNELTVAEAVDLCAPFNASATLGHAIRVLGGTAIDRDFLRLYPSFPSTYRAGDELRVRCEIREALR